MKKKILSLVLVLAMACTMLPTSAFALVTDSTGYTDPSEISQQLIEDNYPQQAEDAPQAEETSVDAYVTAEEVDDLGVLVKEILENAAQEEITLDTVSTMDTVRVMVVLDQEALLDNGYGKSELSSSEALSDAEEMIAVQDELVYDIQAMVADMNGVTAAALAGEEGVEAPVVETKYHFTSFINAVSVDMPYGAIAAVREMEGVETAFMVDSYSLPDPVDNDTAQPAMYATNSGFGTANTWNVGYTGKGMRIAVIDTGLDIDHPSFAAAPAEPSLEKEEINSVLTQLQAYQSYKNDNYVELEVSDFYYSEKVPYGFNYADISLDITHDNDYQGDHGTHVAGITAANKTEGTDVVGVAPDAQLLIMKVFGAGSGAQFDTILAALQDCFLLNVDAVNMSLGSPAGFTKCDEDDKIFAALSDEIYKKIESYDMVVSIAAGNSYSSAYNNGLGTNVNLASDPDNSTVSSPATYEGGTVVASMENVSYRANYLSVGDNKIAYTDDAVLPITDIPGTYKYVMVPGMGAASDFEGLDLTGKVAVISRGEIAFTEKQENALAAGAVACIVYDNVEGELSYMQDSGLIPNVFISKASGQIMKDAADENGEGTLTIHEVDDMMTVESSVAGQMSDFSSWGVSPDLTLQPDVTAPGGQIYSTTNDGTYSMMSGTSMAAPHIAGMAALVLEYLHDQYPDEEESWYHAAAEGLIMSTAEPIVEDTGVLYSPRKQGAGAANVYSAVSSASYLTVDGGAPKVSYGDDDAKNGKYIFSFEINNISDEAQTYVLAGSALTDQVQEIDGVKYMGETSRNLDATFAFWNGDDAQLKYDYNGDGAFDRDDAQALLDDVNLQKESLKTLVDYDFNKDGKINTADVQYLLGLIEQTGGKANTVTVPAGETVTVYASVTLTAEDKAYMDENYENGIYVDGFVRLYQVGGTNDLSLPFLAFYGDWSDARIFDEGAWINLEEPVLNRYYNVVWAGDSYTLGMNPYIEEDLAETEHNVLSPNGDGYQDAITNFYLSLMRNAKRLDFIYKDADGNVVHETSIDNLRKSYYSSSYGLCLPFIYSAYQLDEDDELYDFLDENGDCAYEDLSRLTLTVEGYLDDGDDLVDDSFTVPLIIDTEKPTMDTKNIVFNHKEDGSRELSITVSDNYDIAALVTMTTAGDIMEVFPVDTKEAGVDGETAVVTIDVSKYDQQFYIALCDYGLNESYYEINFSGKHNVNSDAFYAYRNRSVVTSGDATYILSNYNGWHSFEDPSNLVMHTSQYSLGESLVVAADYVDGYVIGIDEDGDIFAMASGNWTRNSFGAMGEYPTALDMAYDFANDTMYVLTDEATVGAGGYLLTLDVKTGALTEIGKVTGFAGEGQGLTLACDNDGKLYTVETTTGNLYTIDNATAVATLVGETGYCPSDEDGAVGRQSMTVDHETNTLYWAAFQGWSGESNFYAVDKTSGELTLVGAMQYNSEVTALYKPYTKAGEVFEENAALTAMKISDSSLSLAKGNMVQLEVQADPYYAQMENISWSSDDTAVVTVDKEGIITAVGAGSAVVTAKCGDVTADCEVFVIEVDADLVLYDAGSSYLWWNFNAGDFSSAEAIADAVQPNGDYDVFLSAAYAKGNIYAFDSNGIFYKIDAETMKGSRIGANSSVNGGQNNDYMVAMAYNYADGYLYGLFASLTNSTYGIARINPSNGAMDEYVAYFDGYAPLNMAIDPEGNFYSVVDVTDEETGLTTTQLLCYTYDENEWGGHEINVVSETPVKGYTAGSYSWSSLVYSYENQCFFWADYNGYLWFLNQDGEKVLLGTIGSTMSVCLVERPQEEMESHSDPAQSAEMAESYRIIEGGSVAAGLSVYPWNTDAKITYKTEDRSIAKVSENGIITGVEAGTTTLTVTVEGLEPLTAEIVVTKSADTLYGYVLADASQGTNYFVSFSDTDPVDIDVLHENGDGDWWPYAGAYYDGYIYAYAHDTTGAYNYSECLVKIDPSDFSGEYIGQIHDKVYDMAFDYTTGVMYALVSVGTEQSGLAQVNLETGETYLLGKNLEWSYPWNVVAICVDDGGNLYGFTSGGVLCNIDKEDGSVETIFSTGLKGGDYQSMHYDYATGNAYLAQMDSEGGNGLYLLNLETAAATNLGVIGNGSYITCLYTEPSEDVQVPQETAVTDVLMMEKNVVTAGETLTLSASVLPFSVAKVDKTLTWSSSDETVATVANGVVTGVAAGVAEITATAANGVSATCKVTVTAEPRRFYTYDETNRQWISFASNDLTDIQVERKDAEGEEKIMASVYMDSEDLIYAYTEDGKFITIDPDTFERSEPEVGVSEQTIPAYCLTYDENWNLTEELYDLSLVPVDMTWGESSWGYDALYVMFQGNVVTDEYGYYYPATVVAEVDPMTGEVLYYSYSFEAEGGNLVESDGMLYFVDTFVSGILYPVDPNEMGMDEYAEVTLGEDVEIGLVTGNWGGVFNGRGFVKDQMTDTIYVIRDLPENGGQPILYTMNLKDADIEKVGRIGDSQIIVNGLFIR